MVVVKWLYLNVNVAWRHGFLRMLAEFSVSTKKEKLVDAARHCGHADHTLYHQMEESKRETRIRMAKQEYIVWWWLSKVCL